MDPKEPLLIVTVLPLGGKFSTTKGRDLISAMLAQGVAFLEYGCRRGNCGRCLARVSEGEVEHRPFNVHLVDPAQQDQGWVLPCQTFAKTDLKLTQRT